VSTRGIAIATDMNPLEFKPKPKWRDEHAVIIFFIMAIMSAYLMDVAIDAFVYHYGSFWDVFVSTSPGILFGRIYIVISFAVIGVFMDLYITYRRRTEERFSTLNSYGRKLYAAKDIQEVCRSTLDAMEKTLGFNYATFMVLEGSNLEVVGYRGQTKPRFHRLQVFRTKGITARAAKTGVPVLVRDVTEDKDYVADFPGVRSELAVPIAAEGKISGVLDVESCRLRAFNEKDATLLQVLASYAGTAISNLSKRGEIEKRSSQLASLMKTSAEMMRSTDLQRRLRTIAEAIRDLGWRRVVISVRDENMEMRSSDDLVTVGLTDEEREFIWNKRPPGNVLRERFGPEYERFKIGRFYYLPWSDPWVRNKQKNWPNLVESHLKAEDMIDWDPQDMLYAPLQSADRRIVGRLAIDDPADGKRPTLESLAPLELFLSQAAVAIENAHLIRQLNDARTEVQEYAEKLEERVQERTKSLKDSQEKLRSIFAASPDAITAIDVNGKIVECNEKACQMYGYSRDELVGMSILELIANGDKRRASKLLRKMSEEEMENVEYRFVRKDGSEFPAELSTSVLLNASGEPTGSVNVTKDITKRKQMEQELFKSERLAAIGELAGMIGHDLRNPLTGIASASYFLKKKGRSKLDSKELEMIDTIEKCVDYSNKIINDLLDYSRELKLELTETNPKLLLTQALSLLQVPANVHIVDKTCEEPTLRADSAKMLRVFLNLMKNALEAMPNGGKLSIESHAQDEQVAISFSDNGVGIPEESISKLWTPFQTTKAKGMGLGLPICKRIVEAHGGQISASSILKKGTVITLTLPTNLSIKKDTDFWINLPQGLVKK
jgi:PAS domain S-box-containing protein